MATGSARCARTIQDAGGSATEAPPGRCVAAPRPRPPTRGYCYDPGFQRTYGGRRLDEETDSNDTEIDSNDVNDSPDNISQDNDSQDTQDTDSQDDAEVQKAPAESQDDSNDGNGQGSGMSSDDASNDVTDDDDKDRRRQTLRAPNPQSNTRCRDAFDCDGVSVYCYESRRGNYCKRGDGIGSLCRNQAGCGWIGRDRNARKMTCRSRNGRAYCRDPWARRN